MGLFNNYTKPGPGVRKDEPKKTGLKLLFSTMKDHFWDIFKVSMLYFITSLPMLVIYGFLGAFVSNALFFSVADAVDDVVISQFYISFMLMIAFMLTIFVGTGPASASVAYIFRNYFRGEHVWFWDDFKKKIKENFKQSIAICIINLVTILLMGVAISFYYNQYLQTQKLMWFVLTIIIGIIFVLFIISQFYIYQLVVTFYDKVRNFYKISFILAIAKLPQNLCILAIITIICYLIYTSFQPGMSIFIGALLLVGLLRFIIEWYATELVEKTILKNTQDKQNEIPEETDGSENE